MSDEKKLSTEDVLNYLGLSDVNSIEDLQTKFPTEYFRQSSPPDELKSKITAIAFKSTNKAVREGVKNKYGVELTNAQVDGKPLEEIVFHVVDTIKSNYDSLLDEEKRKSGEPSEAMKEIEKDRDKYKNKVSELDGLLKNTNQAWEEKYNSTYGAYKKTKVSYANEKTLSKVPISTNVKPLELDGYHARIEKNFIFDIDEDTNEHIVMGIDGKRIENPKKAGQWKTPLDVYMEIAEAENIIEINQHAKNNTQQQQTTQKFQTPPQQQEGRAPRMTPFGM